MAADALAAEMPVAARVDRALSEISHTFDFLSYVTPINGDEAWRQFRDGGCRALPELKYRPLRFDPDRLKSELYRLPLEEVEDADLAQLMHGKQEELDLEISMLRHRGRRRFFYGSLQRYGEPEDELQRLARLVLEELDGAAPATDDCTVDSEEMAAAARREIAVYRQRYAGFAASVEVCEDRSSLMVSGGDLLVPAGKRYARRRVEPLIHHEVGTHLVTYYNGDAQPLELLCAGLAGYDPIQEGLAVLAEHLAGGLTVGRLRLLAARVLVCAGLVDRHSFPDSVAYLVEEVGFGERRAFDVALRVYRGGGLTKDMIYLRGLRRVLGYLENDGELEPLLAGKMALEHVPALARLAERGLLKGPVVRPRYLDLPGADERLARLREGASVLELARGARK